MSDSPPLPAIYTSCSSETPLDLTTRRPDMDPNDYNYFNRYHENQTAYGLQLDQEYQQQQQHQQHPSQQYYHYLQGNEYNSSDDIDGISMTSNMTSSLMTPSGYVMPSSSPTTMSHYSSSPQSAYDSDSSIAQNGVCNLNEPGYKYDSPSSSDSSILPKKRKNLWRPYDSKAAAAAQFGFVQETDRDADSSSDSNPGSFSDQEFKTPAPPSDPVKKRKMNMLSYSEHPSVSGNLDRPLSEATGNDRHQREDNISSQKTSPEGNPIYSDDICYDRDDRSPQSDIRAKSLESISGVKYQCQSERQKVIAGMKKRDIFGWSLKLMKTSDQPETELTSEKDSGHVCKDGDKTYIELQTVRKGDAQAQSQTDVIVSKAESSHPSNDESVKKSSTKRASPVKGAESKQKNKSGSLEKENRNIVGKKVFIQRRDNVIECVDESQNTPEKPDVKKGVSLIDLIEEIEASALRQQNEKNVLKTNKHRHVAALLEQCNHVKLQALDFLMSNVLIQDKDPQYKCKNETVQKMLNGDKIGSVSMLDVVELQVEIGLS